MPRLLTYLSGLFEELHQHLRYVDVVLGDRNPLQDKPPACTWLLAQRRRFHLVSEVGQRQFTQTLLVEVPDPVEAIHRDGQHAAVRMHRYQHGNGVTMGLPVLGGLEEIGVFLTLGDRKHRVSLHLHPAGGSGGVGAAESEGMRGTTSSLSMRIRSSVVVSTVVGTVTMMTEATLMPVMSAMVTPMTVSMVGIVSLSMRVMTVTATVAAAVVPSAMAMVLSAVVITLSLSGVRGVVAALSSTMTVTVIMAVCVSVLSITVVAAGDVFPCCAGHCVVLHRGAAVRVMTIVSSVVVSVTVTVSMTVVTTAMRIVVVRAVPVTMPVPCSRMTMMTVVCCAVMRVALAPGRVVQPIRMGLCAVVRGQKYPAG